MVGLVSDPPEPPGHLSQYHRFLQRFLQSWILLPVQVVVGLLQGSIFFNKFSVKNAYFSSFWQNIDPCLFPHEVRYVFHSHFRTFFQQLRLLGSEAKV